MRKLIFLTFFLVIHNYLLSGQNSNCECDTTIFLMVKQMPLYFGDFEERLNEISSKLTPEMKSFIRNNDVHIKLVVTCKGEVKIRSFSEDFDSFCRLLEDELNKLNWIPAKNNEEAVNFQSILPVRIYNFKLFFPLPMIFKMAKGMYMTGVIIDEDSNLPIPDAMLITRYNDYPYISNEQGEVGFYCGPGDVIEVNHVNYQTVTFSAIEQTTYKIQLKNVIYNLEAHDLIKYNPKKLPNRNYNCKYNDFIYNKINNSHIIGYNDKNGSKMAEFNEGYGCLYNYLSEKFVLPKDAEKSGYIDTVTVSFTIYEDGSVANVELSDVLDYGLNQSIKDLFYKMPKWRPCTQLGEKLPQQFEIQLIIGVNKYWEKIYRK